MPLLHRILNRLAFLRQDGHWSFVILDDRGSPARRLALRHRSIIVALSILGVSLVISVGMLVHAVFTYQVAHHVRQLRMHNRYLQQLKDDLEQHLPTARNTVAMAELNFNQLWAKSGLGTDATLDNTFLLEAPTANTLGAEQNSNQTATTGEEQDLLDTELLSVTQQLTYEARDLATSLSDTLEYFHDAERMLLNTPSIAPVRMGWYSSSFGVRFHPILHTLLMHKGLDIAGHTGMPIYAPADGIVIWTGRRGGYGQVVVIDHGYGLQTHFAHLSKYLVHVNQAIQRGEKIAEMGTTGQSTGPHLHYEVRRLGVPLDPKRFILDH